MRLVDHVILVQTRRRDCLKQKAWAMPTQAPQSNDRPTIWRRRALLRLLFLVIASAIVAAFVSGFGIVRDFGSFRASVLTGSAGGAYYMLATRLAERAKKDHGRLEIVPTAGSIENVDRLIRNRDRCVEKFAFIQDGTPVPADSGLELLGRLPEP